MKLSYFTQEIQRDRITCTKLFNNMDNRLIGIWDRAIRASANLVNVDKKKHIKSNYWFEFKEDSETFKDIVYEAKFSEEDINLFRTMLETAIKHNLLVDVSEEPEIKELNIEHAYSFKEVLETVNSYLKIDYGKRLGGQISQTSEEEQQLVKQTKTNLLLRYGLQNREHILRFLTEISLDELKKQNKTTEYELFSKWATDNSISLA